MVDGKDVHHGRVEIIPRGMAYRTSFGSGFVISLRVMTVLFMLASSRNVNCT